MDEATMREIANIVNVLGAIVGPNTKMNVKQEKAWNALSAKHFPVYCCDEMEKVVNSEKVTRDVFYFDGSILWSIGSVGIKSCPFCGKKL